MEGDKPSLSCPIEFVFLFKNSLLGISWRGLKWIRLGWLPCVVIQNFKFQLDEAI